MVKTIITSTAFITLFLVLCPVQGRAQVTLSIGGTVWYNQWQPAWHDGRIKVRDIGIKGNNASDIVQDIHDFKSMWMPLYGPVITLGLYRKVVISSYFVYGTTVFRSDGNASNIRLNYGTGAVTPTGGYRMYKRETVKMDSDTTIGFNVTNYFMIYAGYKYQSYRYNENSKALHNYTDPITSTPRNKQNDNHGAGLGVGFNIHLYDSLFLYLGVSGVLLAGRERSSLNYHAGVISGNMGASLDKNGNYLAYGGTFIPSLSYVTPINITLTLGFRAQLLRYRQLYGKQAYELFNNQMDLFYGFTFSAIYTFNLVGEAKTPEGP